MPAETIPLDRAIADARKRFDEANDLFQDPPASDPGERAAQRSMLVDPLSALDERILALEAVRDELAAASVIVEDVTAAEVQQIRDALTALDTAIKRTQTFQANLAILTGALGAVSTIAGAAKGGHPADATAAGTSALSMATASAATRATPVVARVRSANVTPRGTRYVCRMAHHEDLTDKVNEALKDTVQTAGIRSITAKGPATVRRIRVTCSETHVNVFEVP